ncbi:Rrf2 family transcriptional regulator [Marinilactibacillus kalidii]|uniref:Rrf2 family transcriptional regulator n=1 Tax=Marinilactibacillus kalidii TaxID=2820274 RepID=UPI001ABED077|nr:Rrf2 family transcriptional regulator [Marinilactibacillus kalidii]
MLIVGDQHAFVKDRLLQVVIEEKTVISGSISSSVKYKSSVIGKIIGTLRKADLIKIHHGVAGVRLMSAPEEITLLDIENAIAIEGENSLFSKHHHYNCIVSKSIQETIQPIFQSTQLAMQHKLKPFNLKDSIENIFPIEEIRLKKNDCP